MLKLICNVPVDLQNNAMQNLPNLWQILEISKLDRLISSGSGVYTVA